MPSDIRFADLRKLLESHGWDLSRIKGSHHIFTKEGEWPIVFPVHRRQVKYAYVRKIKEKLEIPEED